MGAGLAGGPLTGGPVAAGGTVTAAAGASAIVVGPLGAGPADIVTKAGSSVADGAVNAGAKLFAVGTGIGGTEVDYFSVMKGLAALLGNASTLTWTAGGANVWNIAANISAQTMTFGINASAYMQLRGADGFVVTGFGFEVNPTLAAPLFRATSAGRVDQSGTDFSASPGAQTIDKPSGKAAIAIGASSVVITSNQVTAASRVMITPQSRDATCKELIAVPGAGSFTVSGSGVATAALVFSFEISNIL